MIDRRIPVALIGTLALAAVSKTATLPPRTPSATLAVRVTEAVGRKPLAGVTIRILDKTNVVLGEGATQDAGLFEREFPGGTELRIRCERVDLVPVSYPDQGTLALTPPRHDAQVRIIARNQDDAYYRAAIDELEEDARQLSSEASFQLHALLWKQIDQLPSEARDRVVRYAQNASPQVEHHGIAIPSLLQARVASNESAAIGDTRTILSAEAAYATVNNGYYDRLECLALPSSCIPGYSPAGPTFLDATLAALATRAGYARQFNPGTPVSNKTAWPVQRQGGSFFVALSANEPMPISPTSMTSFSYVATPVAYRKTGLRSYCVDSFATIAFVDAPVTGAPGTGGRCPADWKRID